MERRTGLPRIVGSICVAAILIVVFATPSVSAQSNGTLPLSYHSVTYHALTGTFKVIQGKNTNAVGWAAYAGVDSFMKYGWAYLSIETNAMYPDEVQAAGAGYLEGFVTQDMIWNYWTNYLAIFTSSPPLPVGLQEFLSTHEGWIQQQIQANPHDPYWQEISLIEAQLDGLVAGYNLVAPQNQQLTRLEFRMMNMDGDLEELLPKYGSNWNGLALSALKQRKAKMAQPAPGHCTSLIRLTPDGQELYTSHTTWSSYVEMNRIFKSYVLRTKLSGLQTTNSADGQVQPANGVLFSSYPATLCSNDDFYVLSNYLAVTETTNGINNPALFSQIVPNTVLFWMRVIVANRLATSAESWTQIFARYNSGTYNNQMIVVDYNRFTPGQPLPDGTLWIAEQIPGYMYRADVTEYLRVGFWESYNIPFDRYIYNISGFASLAQQYGNSYTHSMCPRATIFRRQAGDVQSLNDMKRFIRYNNWKNDPLALGDAGNQISSRYDLNTNSDRSAFGGIDGKVTSYALIRQGIAHGQSGPTHDQVPVFNWANFPGLVHNGQPTVWNFNWLAFNFTSAWTL